MSERDADLWLRSRVAWIFRGGTVIAVTVIAIGYVASLFAGADVGTGSLATQLLAGGPTAIIAAGLLGLTLLPLGVVVTLIAGFARGGERGRAATGIGVLVLLVASLITAAILAGPG